jgi:quercetin dioxygenase-like cupin family protein
MKMFRPTSTSVAAVVAVAMISVASAGPATHVMLTPEELKWTEIPSLPAGAPVATIQGPADQAVPFTFRIKMPAGYEIPAHWHPAIEHVTVISGTFNMGVGDELDKTKTHALETGSVAIIQPHTNHFAWTDEETVVQLHGVGPWGISYVNPADDPRGR